MSDNWTAPLPFIQFNGDQLEIVEETARLLAEVSKPVVVVVIAGVYRTGKSYLLNRLANKSTGFPLGNTLQSKTKGIWVWCLPHPSESDCSLLLLDTEGLSDPEKGSERNDTQLLCLSVLLSSLFVYNAIGRIDSEMIRRLYFISEILDNIAVRERTTNEECLSEYEELREFLPDFALVVRDFSLELKLEEQTLTPDEYLNRVLQPKGHCPTYNRPREAIRRAFHSHRCFVFTRPVGCDELFCKLESLAENQLSPIFLEQSREFCRFVTASAGTKKIGLQDGQTLSGKAWLALAREYVATISSDAIPCLESAFVNVAEITSLDAMNESMRIYQEEIKNLKLPLTTKELLYSHRLWSKRALWYYSHHSPLDTDGTYRTALKVQLSEALRDLKTENRECSKRRCQLMLDNIYDSIIQSNILNGSYVGCVYGYRRYKADLRDVRNHYNSEEVINARMHAKVLQAFLAEKEGEKQTIKCAVGELKKEERQWQELRRERENAEREERRQTDRTEARRHLLDRERKEQEEQIKRRTAEQERVLNERRSNHDRIAREALQNNSEHRERELQENDLSEEKNRGCNIQ